MDVEKVGGCRIIRSTAAMQEWSKERTRQSAVVGLVPTMGALHEGHLNLVRRCLAKCDQTVVSIFLNPTQFAPDEDLGRYPKPFQRDCELLSECGELLVFAPDTQEMYPPGCTTEIQPPRIAEKFEGASRPFHFQGVTTVVAKLFLATLPNWAFFGQKDYQQTLVVQQMVADLRFPVKIEICPIVRDKDGLALSSRNVYLSRQERQMALSIPRALEEVRSLVKAGEKSIDRLEATMEMTLRDSGIREIDYAQIVDAHTLESFQHLEFPAVGLIAARVGQTRLIDNLLITN